jgi:hypothetical protein
MTLRVNAVRHDIQALGTVISGLFLVYMVSLYSRPVAVLLAALAFGLCIIRDWSNRRFQRKTANLISNDETLDL